jgi:uncharacterized protein YndB with AHSA1/START domain
MSSQTVTVRRRMAASSEEVFNAWLEAEGMAEWMRPGAVTRCEVELDPRVGGQFCIRMSGPGIEVMNTGEFRVLERPSKLEFTWISSRWGGEETLVTIELQPHGEACDLLLTHRRFPAEHSAEQLTDGWGRILERLGAHLELRAQDRPNARR